MNCIIIITVLIIFFVGLEIVNELINISVYGSPIKHIGYLTRLESMSIEDLELNTLDPSIMLSMNKTNPLYNTFISNVGGSILFKYYVHGKGLIYRFSRTSKILNEKYDSLRFN